MTRKATAQTTTTPRATAHSTMTRKATAQTTTTPRTTVQTTTTPRATAKTTTRPIVTSIVVGKDPQDTTTTSSAQTSESAITTRSITTTTASFPQNSCTNGFQLVLVNVIPYYAASGKFGGYFLFQTSCEELCRRDYGLLRCIEYMYEPQNCGK